MYTLHLMNRIFSPRLAIFLAIAMVGALMFGGVLHSAIQHTHGYAETDHEHEQNEESASWTNLHSALRHEDKKLLLLLAAITNTVGVVALMVVMPGPQHAIAAVRNTLIRGPLHGDYLRRGIAHYRRFR